jgi:hypothetical protein
MGNRKGIWWTSPDDSLLSKANGFALSVRHTIKGRFEYLVLRDHDDPGAPSSILASGYEQSAVEGMEAAEKAAFRLLRPPAAMGEIGIGAASLPALWPLLMARLPLPKAPAPQRPPKIPRQRRRRRHDAYEQ